MRSQLIITLLCSLTLTYTLSAQNKQLAKAQKKEYKAKMNEFKKDRYKIIGSSRTIEVALLTHYDKLNSDDYEGFGIVSENCPTINLCDRKSWTDAAARYATELNSQVRGIINSATGYDASPGSPDHTAQDKFFGAFEQKVSADISGKLKRSFSVYSEKKRRYESFYYIDEDAAHKARMNALKQAQEETDANVEWADSISDRINQAHSQDSQE